MSIKSSDNTAYGPWTSVPTSPRLVQYDEASETKWYYPLIKPSATLNWNSYIYSYERNIGDTFGIALDNTKYVIPNKRVSAYDIPAGTYSPSVFENLIRSYISNNGSRTVSNNFNVEVNGQTYNVPFGRAIYYTYQYSGLARFVSFRGSQRGSIVFESGNSFSQNGVYCTYWNNTAYGNNTQGKTYYNYPIKLNVGIRFI